MTKNELEKLRCSRIIKDKKAVQNRLLDYLVFALLGGYIMVILNIVNIKTNQNFLDIPSARRSLQTDINVGQLKVRKT